MKADDSVDALLYLNLGAMLRAERGRKGLTLVIVSEMVGVPVRTISRYETGERKIKIDVLMKLCSAYELDFYDFVRCAHELAVRAYEEKR